MKIKEFLKPDWKKLLLTIIIFLIIPAPVPGFLLCKGISCPSLIITPFGTFKLMLEYPSLLLRENFFVYIGLLIASYLVSCLIISIYNKVKVKK